MLAMITRVAVVPRVAVMTQVAVVVCMYGLHAQLTAWVDRVADTGLVDVRMTECQEADA